MKYLCFSNAGELPIEACIYIASSKTGDDTKIGFFGSGLKYTIPLFLKNRVEFHIFSGTEKLEISTEKKSISDRMDFEAILINGQQTSMTTLTGPTWTTWMGIREIYSNMMDEPAYEFTVVDYIEPEAGRTKIYVSLEHEDIKEIYQKFDEYFSQYRDDILNTSENGDYLMRSKSKTINVYRKGIRCADFSIKSLFDYSFDQLAISESRIATESDIETAMRDYWAQCDDPDAILTLLQGVTDDRIFEHNMCIRIPYASTKLNEKAWTAAIGNRRLIAREYSGYVDDLNPMEDLIVPKPLSFYLLKTLPGIKKSRFAGDTPFIEHTMTPYQEAMIKRVLTWFEECNMKINYDVQVVKFTNPQIHGLASKGIIYIGDSCFMKGKDYLAATILEEYLHLKEGVRDESRPFQNLLLEMNISLMQQANVNPL